jgi:hypothetical protein
VKDIIILTKATRQQSGYKGDDPNYDFFQSLDNVEYTAFKTSMLNRWATKAIKLPLTPNEVYKLAGSWTKQPSCTKGGGYSAT